MGRGQAGDTRDSGDIEYGKRKEDAFGRAVTQAPFLVLCRIAKSDSDKTVRVLRTTAGKRGDRGSRSHAGAVENFVLGAKRSNLHSLSEFQVLHFTP